MVWIRTYDMEQLFTKATSTQLTETLELLGMSCTLCQDLNRVASMPKDDMDYRDVYGDLQKAIVGIIRGSEIAFEELTGVKYHTN